MERAVSHCVLLWGLVWSPSHLVIITPPLDPPWFPPLPPFPQLCLKSFELLSETHDCNANDIIIASGFLVDKIFLKCACSKVEAVSEAGIFAYQFVLYRKRGCQREMGWSLGGLWAEDTLSAQN